MRGNDRLLTQSGLRTAWSVRRRVSELCALTRLWVADRFEFDVELVIRREEIPELQMAEGSVGRLGWTSWATSVPGLATDPRIIFPAERVSA